MTEQERIDAKTLAIEVQSLFGLEWEAVGDRATHPHGPPPCMHAAGQSAGLPCHAPDGSSGMTTLVGRRQDPTRIIGSGFIQFPPQRPFERPLTVQPATIATVSELAPIFPAACVATGGSRRNLLR